MEITVESNQELMEVKTESMSALEKARAMAAAIKDHPSFSEACSFRAFLNTRKKERTEKLDPIRASAWETYQKALRLIEEVIAPFKESIAILDKPIGEYNNEQERIKRFKEEQQRRDAQKHADDAHLAAAEQADKSGDHARAEAILEKQPVITTPVVEGAPKVEGVSFRENWKVDPVINMRVLVRAIADGKAPLELVMPNIPVLNSMARSLKGNMNYPGVMVKRETVVASRTIQ